MAKKIGWGIVAAMIAIGVTVFAADNQHIIGLQKDMRALLKGIMSPGQIATLMDFRRHQEERFHGKAGERPDLYGTWKELNLSQEQQEQVLKVAEDLVDKTNPYLIRVMETGSKLKEKVLEGNPDHPAINDLSTQLGKEIGEISWNLALARGQVRSVFTPGQIEVMERLRRQHGIGRKGRVDALPGMADDFAVLWSELKLTPDQADALGAVRRLITRTRQNQLVTQKQEWRPDIVKILTAEQLAVADRFHEKHVATSGTYRLKMGEERERFHNELGLTGEQKVKLIQITLDRRGGIVPCIQDGLKEAAGLREQIHADTPDRDALMAAAASLGDAIGRAAGVGAGLMIDAREVLTAEQMDLVRRHIAILCDQHLEHARIIPAKFHEWIGLLNDLGLSPSQKDQVVKLIAEKHQAQRARHHAMKSIF
jgi:Spy/CpxP family protein refolding chaperone